MGYYILLPHFLYHTYFRHLLSPIFNLLASFIFFPSSPSCPKGLHYPTDTRGGLIRLLFYLLILPSLMTVTYSGNLTFVICGHHHLLQLIKSIFGSHYHHFSYNSLISTRNKFNVFYLKVVKRKEVSL